MRKTPVSIESAAPDGFANALAETPFSVRGDHQAGLYSNRFASGKIVRRILPESVLPPEKRLWYIAARNCGTHPRFLRTTDVFLAIISPMDRLMTPPDVAAPASRWSRCSLCVLALLVPALLSLFHSVTTSRTQAAIQGADRPALAFDQYMVNFGEPQPRSIHEAQFHFRNRSSRTVKITSVKPSCGCLTPKVVGFNAQRRHEERKEFAPGEYGVLAMGIRPAKEQPGDKSYSVVIDYNDGQPRTETLEFRITLPKKKLTVEPNELYFYQLTGDPDSRVVMVRDFRDKPARVMSVEVVTAGRKSQAGPLVGVTAVLGEITAGPDGEASCPIQVDIAPDLAPGRRDGWLVITTDDPDAPLVKIPILLFGKEQATAGGEGKKESGPTVYGPMPRTATVPDGSALE